jgi:hypothetical protein
MLKLKRSYLDNCTIGKLYFKGELICYTMERPWLNNKKSVSCVPEGIYNIHPFTSEKHPDCFYLECNDLGVGILANMQRTYILIHPGNFPHDIEGCIAPGLEMHPSTWGVMHSRKAMEKIRNLINSEGVTQIEIRG